MSAEMSAGTAVNENTRFSPLYVSPAPSDRRVKLVVTLNFRRWTRMDRRRLHPEHIRVHAFALLLDQWLGLIGTKCDPPPGPRFEKPRHCAGFQLLCECCQTSLPS